MPKEFILVEDSTISFMASQDLYNKFLGLALCLVFSVKDGKKELSFDIVPYVNDQRRNVLSGTLSLFDSDHMWVQYLTTNELWGLLEGGVDFGEESYLRFSLGFRVSDGIVKKLGYVIRCKSLKNNLKVVLKDNPLVDPTALCEDSKGSNHRRKVEFFRKCHLYAEDQGSSDSDSDSLYADSYYSDSEDTSTTEELCASESETD